MRDTIEECTGENGMSHEDDQNWCFGWLPKGHPNCTNAKEFEFVSASTLNSMSITAGIRTYGGGGYILELKGYIGDLMEKIKALQEVQWVGNRTRSLMVEFSVYNAQVIFYSFCTSMKFCQK